MIRHQFDPFSDRTARDIRNRLSEIFVDSISGISFSPVCEKADKLLELHPEIVYSNYIHDRLRRYRVVIDEIIASGIHDPLKQAVFIWNARLFYEAHEHLEGLWHKSKAGEKEALKGLIQAAGAFVHRERGYAPGADRLAVKARRLLQEYGRYLHFIDNLIDLLRALNDSAAPSTLFVLKPCSKMEDDC